MATIQDLQRYVREGANESLEGSSTDKHQAFFLDLLHNRSNIRQVGEIGFNAGISAFTFLSARPDITVVSFDIGRHGYVHLAKEFIDDTFPGRHTLIIGNSLQAVPRFRRENLSVQFDLIFVDGSHAYHAAKADITNCAELAHAETLVVMDDLTPWRHWGVGPTRAWNESVRERRVTEIERLADGVPIPLHSTPADENVRVWAVGQYVF